MRQFRALNLFLVLIILMISPVFAHANKSRGISVTTATGESIELYVKSYALVIGVSQYRNGWSELPGVLEDANAVSDALENHGFTVMKVLNPDNQRLKEAFDGFIAEYGRQFNDRLLIYYSGHGYTHKKKWGGDMGYLVPADAPNPHADINGFLDKALDMQQIEVYAKRIDSKHALFLFDTCFSGSIFALSKAAPAAITYKTKEPVRQFITAGNAEEEVPDESVFRRQFVAALNGEGDVNRDGYITGSELGEFIQTRVLNYSKESQHPQYGKIRDPNLDKGDFVFINVGKTPKTSEKTPVRINAEETLWKVIEYSKYPEDFQDYLNAYPNGRLRYSQMLCSKKLSSNIPF